MTHRAWSHLRITVRTCPHANAHATRSTPNRDGMRNAGQSECQVGPPGLLFPYRGGIFARGIPSRGFGAKKFQKKVRRDSLRRCTCSIAYYNMGMSPLTIGYVRTSVATAGGEGLAIQRERIAAWCTFQGLAVDGIEEDEGLSGASTDGRRGFKRAVRRVLEVGKGATLVVYKLDRLGRSALDVQETLAVLLDAGVRVVAIADGVDSAGDMGAALLRLLTGILATFAELERETIIGRLQGGRKHARAKGCRYGREPRYGHVNPPQGGPVKELVPVAEEARAVERIKALRAGGVPYRGIVVALDAEGIRPRSGGRWSLAVVHAIATGARAPAKVKRSSRIARARGEFLEIGEAAE